MTPVLSPKKTWEGFAGGLAACARSLLLAVIDSNRVRSPVLHGGDWAAVGFGVTVGLAGVLGDLAESLIKRDCRRRTPPQRAGLRRRAGRGRFHLFAAPVAYWWLRW